MKYLLYFLIILVVASHNIVNAQCRNELSTWDPTSKCNFYAGVVTSDDLNFCNNNPFVLVYADNFNGNDIDNTFWIPKSVVRGVAVTTTSGDNILVEDGVLKMQCKKEEVIKDGVTYNYTGGEIWSKRRFEFGAFEVRAKLPNKGDGVWSAFWLFGSRYAPTNANYELDIFEANDDENDINIWLSLHKWTRVNGEPISDKCQIWLDCDQDLSDGYHTYKAVWNPGYIEWYIDDQLVRRDSRAYDMSGSEICYIPQYTAISQSYSFTRGKQYIVLDAVINEAKSDTPSSFNVDYLKVWQRFSKTNVFVKQSDIEESMYNVVAGENVRFEADVNISSGEILKVIASGDIVIPNDFSVDLGAELVLESNINAFNEY